VVNIEGFVKKLEADGISLIVQSHGTPTAVRWRSSPDPWGTYIELNERPNAVFCRRQVENMPTLLAKMPKSSSPWTASGVS